MTVLALASEFEEWPVATTLCKVQCEPCIRECREEILVLKMQDATVLYMSTYIYRYYLLTWPIGRPGPQPGCFPFGRQNG